ncbi:MAG: hypothetical protein COC02_05905 [Rhodospirillaceae bacterium]|nr:MAG: hypothetical protein COC02_05905 [Rhodospirillaceae bacterium]
MTQRLLIMKIPTKIHRLRCKMHIVIIIFSEMIETLIAAFRAVPHPTIQRATAEDGQGPGNVGVPGPAL